MKSLAVQERYGSETEDAGILEFLFRSETDKGAFYSEIVQALTDANLDFHVVACGALQPSDYEAVLKAGCSGVAVSGEIADAENPVEATVEICAALDAARKAADADML